MKVSELIEALRQQDQNVQVAIECVNDYGNVAVLDITSVIGQDRRGRIPVLLLRAEAD
jgi:hypothetical protein